MKQFLAFAFVLATTGLLLSNCNNPAPTAEAKDATSAFDLVAAKKAIETANGEFSAFVSKSDSAGLASLYTADAKLMGPNMETVSGRSAIQSAFGGMFKAMGQVGITLSSNEMWGTESLISEEGTFSMTDKDGKQIDKGKYIVLWKMEDGKWKLYRDCWNSDMPPAPAK